MATFELGKTYWGIRTGYGFDRIRQVKLLKAIYKENLVVGYESKDIGKDAILGTSGIQVSHLFYTKAEAEDYRDQLAAVQVEEARKKTDTPEKMLAYLFNFMKSEYDGYCDDKVNADIRVRAQELFGIKLK